MGYENNNEVVSLQLGNGSSSGGKSCKKPVIKALPVVTSVNAQGVTSTGPGGISNLTGNGKHHQLPNGRSSSSSSSRRNSRRRDTCARGHVNSLWSVWYGIIAVGFQAYIAVRCTRRFIGKCLSTHLLFCFLFKILFNVFSLCLQRTCLCLGQRTPHLRRSSCTPVWH